MAGLVIAYEPIWAIGTGRTATAADAQAVCSAIRGCVMGEFGLDAGESVRIQYGGSVKAGTIASRNGSDSAMPALRRKRRRDIAWRVVMKGVEAEFVFISKGEGVRVVTSSGTTRFARRRG